MKERPTPETDLLWHSLNTGKNQPSWWVVAEKMRDLARRLERECDEAREVASGLAEQAKRLRKERDEAREALRKCVWWAECVSRRVTEDRESINWTGLQLARKALADIQMEAAK